MQGKRLPIISDYKSTIIGRKIRLNSFLILLLMRIILINIHENTIDNRKINPYHEE